MRPSRARVGDTVRILVHGFQVSLSLSIWEGVGGVRGTKWAPVSLAACPKALPLTSSTASGPQSPDLCDGSHREWQEVHALLSHEDLGAVIAHGP